MSLRGAIQALGNRIMNFLADWLESRELQDRPSGDGSRPVWKEACDLGLFTLEGHNQGLGHHEALG